MEIVLILGGLFLVYELLKNQEITLANQVASINARVNPTGGVYTGLSAPGTSVPISTSGYALAATGVGAGLQVGESVAQGAAQAGSAVGSAISTAIPIVGSLVAPIFSLLAAHSARVQGATDENSGLNNIIPAVTADIQGINTAYNSGQITPAQAVAALQQVYGNYWNYMAQFQSKPGVAGGASLCAPVSIKSKADLTSTNTAYTPCNKACTAGCCHGCNYTLPNITKCIWAIQNGGGTVTMMGEGSLQNTSGKFGGGVFNSYSLTWNTPKAQTGGILSGFSL